MLQLGEAVMTLIQAAGLPLFILVHCLSTDEMDKGPKAWQKILAVCRVKETGVALTLKLRLKKMTLGV